MTFLTALLLFKITVTLVFVVLPFAAFDPERILLWTGIEATVPLARIYAVAICALLVGYGLALLRHLRGAFPADMLWVGLVSNAGATAVLAGQGTGLMRWLGMGAFGAIALGLAAVLAVPKLAQWRGASW